MILLLQVIISSSRCVEHNINSFSNLRKILVCKELTTEKNMKLLMLIVSILCQIMVLAANSNSVVFL